MACQFMFGYLPNTCTHAQLQAEVYDLNERRGRPSKFSIPAGQDCLGKRRKAGVSVSESCGKSTVGKLMLLPALDDS